MSNIQIKTEKYYVRVHLKQKIGEQYLTLGPYNIEKAQNLADKYLSTGICSWIEKVEK